MDRPKEIYGIDFSGAVDAGAKIWVAKGCNKGGALIIGQCLRGDELAGAGKERNTCLRALVAFVKAHPAAALGFDFPFGLPEVLVWQKRWEAFLWAFPMRYRDPDHFRETCFKEAGGKELKRATDAWARTPFASYNRRVYKQTYFGITRVLEPLAREDCACILPMQKASRGKPWVMEICPASTLKAFGLYHINYKGKGNKHREGRERVLESLSRAVPFQLADGDLEKRLLENPGGDALDSVIAAAGTFQALRREDLFAPRDCKAWKLEGYVYA